MDQVLQKFVPGSRALLAASVHARCAWVVSSVFYFTFTVNTRCNLGYYLNYSPIFTLKLMILET